MKMVRKLIECKEKTAEYIQEENKNIVESNKVEIIQLKSGILTCATTIINGYDGSNSTTTITTEELDFIADNTTLDVLERFKEVC